MRPLAPDLDPSKLLGRRMTCRFEMEKDSDVGSAQVCAFGLFWKRVSAEGQDHDPAVRHAVIALGSVFRLTTQSETGLPEGFTPESLELFAIQHYNLTIARLQPMRAAVSWKASGLPSCAV